MISKAPRETKRKTKMYNQENTRIGKRVGGKQPRKVVYNPPFLETIDSSRPTRITGRDILMDYLENSMIHGLQYFGNLSIKVGRIGKIIWTCTIIASFVCSSLMVMQFWGRYRNNPTNTLVETFYAPIFMVPFPAITICPFSPSLLRRQEELLRELKLPSNVSREDAQFIFKYAHDLGKPYITQRYKYLNKFKAILKENDMRLVDILRKVRPCEDIVETCWWNQKRIDCLDVFRTSHSSRGVCCSFNYILEDYIRLGGDSKDVQPLYTDRYGPTSGLRVVFNREMLIPDNHTDSLSRMITNSDGMMVSVHQTTDFPGDEIQARILQAGQEIQLSVIPSLYQKSPDLYYQNDEGQTVRICVTETKDTLKYFPKYQYSTCYASCRIDAMIRTCGCLPFNYDPVAVNYSIKHCELDGLSCLDRNSKYLRVVKTSYKNNFTCTCKHPCENVIYEAVPSKFSMNGDYLKFATAYQNISPDQAVLRVYMNSQVFTVLKTVPAANEIYLLASVGGIFSLFLGCSFLSIFEILYYAGLFYRAVFLRHKSNSIMRKRRTIYNNIQNSRLSFY